VGRFSGFTRCTPIGRTQCGAPRTNLCARARSRIQPRQADTLRTSFARPFRRYHRVTGQCTARVITQCTVALVPTDSRPAWFLLGQIPCFPLAFARVSDQSQTREWTLIAETGSIAWLGESSVTLCLVSSQVCDQGQNRDIVRVSARTRSPYAVMQSSGMMLDFALTSSRR
jgi:hypothetical protein